MSIATIVDHDQPETVVLPRRLRAVRSEPPFLDDWDSTPSADAILPLVVTAASTRLDATGQALGAPQLRPVLRDEVGDLFGARSVPRSALPDPRVRAAAVVRIVLEVLCGDRPTRQIAGWVAPAVLEHLERRTAERIRRQPRQSRLRSLRVSEPAECVAEVSAVITSTVAGRTGCAERYRAVALRMEAIDARWIVTALAIG